MEPTPRPSNRVGGLDSLRFVCALWVTFSHNTAPPLTDSLSRDTHLGVALRGLYGNIWNGQAAVVVFFVISGFCIHYPFAGTDKQPSLAVFYSRRFIRLLIPMAVTILLMKWSDPTGLIFEHSVLWSLVAELIYYVLYPVLRLAQSRLGTWKPLILVAYVAAYVVVFLHPTQQDYHTFGNALNWVVGLPCWLLGCALAETVRQSAGPAVSPGIIWAWRAGMVGAAWACSVLRFHSPIGYPWTLDLLALGMFVWLWREIVYRKVYAPARWLEWAGLWSYSLYLMHPVAITLYHHRFPNNQTGGLYWLGMTAFVLVVSYAFYLLVEWPSHTLARGVSARLRPGGTAGA